MWISINQSIDQSVNLFIEITHYTIIIAEKSLDRLPEKPNANRTAWPDNISIRRRYFVFNSSFNVDSFLSQHPLTQSTTKKPSRLVAGVESISAAADVASSSPTKFCCRTSTIHDELSIAATVTVLTAFMIGRLDALTVRWLAGLREVKINVDTMWSQQWWWFQNI